MEEHVANLTGLAFVAALAVVMGMLFVRLRQPAIIGYILTGILLGPTGFKLVSHAGSITLFAEMGVIMLLFLIGMELSLRAFVMVLRPAVLTALAQIVVALVITMGFSVIFDWSLGRAILLAFIVAVSSTAVAMRMLDDIGELRTATGRITVGVLIAQDIAIVPMLVLVASLGRGDINWLSLAAKMLITTGILVGAIYFLTRRGKLTLPFTEAISGKVDMVALASLAFCFASAALTGSLGLSAAFGAFIAGLVVANSTMRAEAITVTEPIQSVLMVVFFLSIGLLIDLDYVLDNLALVLTFVIGVLIAKSAVNVALLHLAGEPWERAFPAGLIMAQIGEFSFVLAAVGFQNWLFDTNGYKLAIAVIAVSLLVSPLWMSSIRRFHDVARQGITDFRLALARTYSDELYELERGAVVLRGLRRSLRRRMIALRIAWRNGRIKRAQNKAAKRMEQDIAQGKSPAAAEAVSEIAEPR